MWIKDLEEGKAAAGNVTVIAHSNIEMTVRNGAQKPDISLPEAFKQTRLAAKSIINANLEGGGPSGWHMGKVMERPEIVNEMKPNTIFENTTDFGAMLASDEAEVALYQLPNLVQSPGIEIVCALPGNLQ